REEQPPSALPVEPRRRFGQPHRVTVAESKGRKHTGAGVGDKRHVEVSQPAAAEIDAGEDQKGNRQPPSNGASDVSADGADHSSSINGWPTGRDAARSSVRRARESFAATAGIPASLFLSTGKVSPRGG